MNLPSIPSLQTPFIHRGHLNNSFLGRSGGLSFNAPIISSASKTLCIYGGVTILMLYLLTRSYTICNLVMFLVIPHHKSAHRNYTTSVYYAFLLLGDDTQFL